MHIQYIPRNMHTVFALLCFVVVIHWLIFPYPSGLLHWHCGNLTIAPVPAKQPWWIWINTSCEFIMNDCITTTKQSTTKPCAYFLGYTVYRHICNIPQGHCVNQLQPMWLTATSMCGSVFWAIQDKARRDKTRQCSALWQPDKTRRVAPGFEKYWMQDSMWHPESKKVMLIWPAFTQYGSAWYYLFKVHM